MSARLVPAGRPIEPNPPSILAIYRLPAFWTGAASARAEMMRQYGIEADDALSLIYHRAIGAHESIADALISGKPIEKIPQFLAWREGAHKRAVGARDALDVVRR